MYLAFLNTCVHQKLFFILCINRAFVIAWCGKKLNSFMNMTLKKQVSLFPIVLCCKDQRGVTGVCWFLLYFFYHTEHRLGGRCRTSWLMLVPHPTSCGRLSRLSLLWIRPINLFTDVFVSSSILSSLFPRRRPLSHHLSSLSRGEVKLTLSVLTGHAWAPLSDTNDQIYSGMRHFPLSFVSHDIHFSVLALPSASCPDFTSTGFDLREMFR